MELSDVIPWPWFGAAAVAATRARGEPSWWVACAGAVALATVHLWGWNKPIYFAGKQVLMDFGVYDDRLVFKVALALVFFPIAAWLGFRAWRWSRRLASLHRAALGLMVVDALYVAIRTLSIDGWMPLAIGLEPGKSILGLSLAGLSLLALAFAGAPRPEVDDGAR